VKGLCVINFSTTNGWAFGFPEEIRATIPDRIIQLEAIIIEKQKQMFEEENFARSCELNSEIHELASVINDLNIWFRVQQDYETKTHQ
jgi:hypothetical protein